MPRNTNPVDGKAIRDKREKLELSAPQLAELIGVTAGKIYKWEGGAASPNSKADYKRITDFLKGIINHEKLNNILNPTKKKAILKSNGVVKDDFKEKYYALLEKYTLLLENKP